MPVCAGGQKPRMPRPSTLPGQVARVRAPALAGEVVRSRAPALAGQVARSRAPALAGRMARLLAPAALLVAGPLAAAAAGVAEAGGGADGEAGGEAAPVITVYGTRSQREAFSYPGMVAVLDRAEIELVQPSSVADLFRAIPSVQFSGGPRRTGQSPAVRGFGRENVLILVDGARQSFVSAHDGRFFLDPELLVRAEAVRGPSSALYGSGAVGGVLAFETASAQDLLRPGERAGMRLRGGFQTANREWLGVGTAFARTLDERASFLGSLGVRESGAIRLGNGFDLPSDDRINTWLLKGDVALGDGVRLEAGWTGFANRALEPNNGQGLALGGGTGTLADVEKRVGSDTLRGTLKVAPPGQTWLDANVTVYRTGSDVDELELATRRRTLRDITTTGVSARNRSILAEGDLRAALLAGFDWYRDRQIGTDSAAPDGTRAGVPDGEAEFAGAYVQVELDLDRPLGLPGTLTLIPGLRYDRFESRATFDDRANKDDAWSGRIATSWAPVPQLLLFASWGQAFRAPSINELYLSGVHFPVPHPVLGPPRRPPVFVTNNFVPNPDLVPERTRTLELGAGLAFENVALPGDRLELKGAWWTTRARDLIDLFVDFRFSPTCFAPPAFTPCSAGTTESRNVTAARLSGFELDLRWTSERFDLVGAFSSIDGRDREAGTPLGALTPDRGSLDARFKLPELALLIGARLETAARFDKGRDPMDIRPGYATLDLYAGWEPPFARGLRLDVRIDNLFDREVVRTFAGVVEPGRNLCLTLSTRFGG
jgi:hemoglobin/transferrin/lactoferrin receptor protein